VWRGDEEGSVAHDGKHEGAGEQDGGDASIPTHRPRHPCSYETNQLRSIFVAIVALVALVALVADVLFFISYPCG
jgi:hypothetical protein